MPSAMLLLDACLGGTAQIARISKEPKPKHETHSKDRSSLQCFDADKQGVNVDAERQEDACQ